MNIRDNEGEPVDLLFEHREREKATDFAVLLARLENRAQSTYKMKLSD
jgi:hypothetical protein